MVSQGSWFILASVIVSDAFKLFLFGALEWEQQMGYLEYLSVNVGNT